VFETNMFLRAYFAHFSVIFNLRKLPGKSKTVSGNVPARYNLPSGRAFYPRIKVFTNNTKTHRRENKTFVAFRNVKYVSVDFWKLLFHYGVKSLSTLFFFENYILLLNPLDNISSSSIPVLRLKIL